MQLVGEYPRLRGGVAVVTATWLEPEWSYASLALVRMNTS